MHLEIPHVEIFYIALALCGITCVISGFLYGMAWIVDKLLCMKNKRRNEKWKKN